MSQKKVQTPQQTKHMTPVQEVTGSGRSKRKRKINSKYLDDFVSNGLGMAMGLSASLYEQEKRFDDFVAPPPQPSIQLTPPGSPRRETRGASPEAGPDNQLHVQAGHDGGPASPGHPGQVQVVEEGTQCCQGDKCDQVIQGQYVEIEGVL